MEPLGDRLTRLRAVMAEHGLDALIVPRADEYLGEYVPPQNERLMWVSDFSGSAGVAIIMADRAAVFADGRYTVQVRAQVDESLYEIHHLVETPHVAWLAEQLPPGSKVGYEPRVHTLNWQRAAAKTLGKQQHALIETDGNLVDLCWRERPQASVHKALLLGEEYTGRSSLDKRKAIGAAVAEQGASAALIFAADSVCWLLNVRGRDIPSLPLLLSFALLHDDGRVDLFTDPEKIPEGFHAHVGEGVTVSAESDARAAFSALEGQTVLADPATANAWCQLALERAGAILLAADDPVLLPKAAKNPVEVEGMRQAHIRDGVAEVKFLAWLDREVMAGNLHTEATLAERLFAFRAEQPLFQEVSFDTISAAAANAALPHYNHQNFPDEASLQMDSVYLVDSGGQYLDGTTDITRTVAIGNPSEAIRRHFTLVLKGHIALDQARFPEGTTGTQLDILARQYLWRDGLDYDHGTGHGVGAFLSVHEGPQRISKVASGVALQPGMVISNEPGYYLDGSHGIRCENLVVVKESSVPGEAGRTMYEFEAITLAPFDRRLIVPELLTDEEIDWLNHYHTRVRETLATHLEGEDLTWLQQATQPISTAGEQAA
ncbi:MAG: aminopeptidase P family protein [Pseudomonadota bacterium]